MAYVARFNLPLVNRWYTCVKCKTLKVFKTDHTGKVVGHCPTCGKKKPHYYSGVVKNESKTK